MQLAPQVPWLFGSETRQPSAAGWGEDESGWVHRDLNRACSPQRADSLCCDGAGQLMLFPSSIAAITGSLLHEYPSSMLFNPSLLRVSLDVYKRPPVWGELHNWDFTYTNLKPAVWGYFKSHFDLIKTVQFGGGGNDPLPRGISSFLPKVKISLCKWEGQPL